MKYTFGLLFFLFWTIASSAQNFDDPGEYMSYIGKQQENISKKYLSYASASAHGKRARKVENLRQKLLNEVQESRMNINAMPSFKGDKAYRDTAVSFMKLYFNILNDDYARVLNLEEIAEQSYDEMEALLMVKEQIDQKLDDGNKQMKDAQAAFAASYGITLVDAESELGDKMKKVRELNHHYNEVYLPFFKPYMQEKNLMEAIEKGNVTGIEQARSAMKSYAGEGLEKLKTIKPYDGDNAVITACRNLLNFYLREAESASAITDFLLAKESFGKAKTDFEKSRRTKEDTDAYNKAVKAMNDASSKYNQVANSLNRERADQLNAWNKIVNRFFDEHTPRYK